MSALTQEQAYAAMFYFLDQLYNRTKAEYLGGLLGGMSLLDDGIPADPAVVTDWQRAVEYAVSGGKAGLLDLK